MSVSFVIVLSFLIVSLMMLFIVLICFQGLLGTVDAGSVSNGG